MAITFDAQSYTAIRALINVGLTDVQLPDAIIELPIYQNEAISCVTRRLTETQITDYAEESKNAAYYFCASLLVPAVSQIENESIAGGEIRWKSQDYQKRAAELKLKAESIIADIDSRTETGEVNTSKLIPTYFGIAKAKGKAELPPSLPEPDGTIINPQW